MVELLPHTRNKSANSNYELDMREVPTCAGDGKVTVEGKSAFVRYVAVEQPFQNEFVNLHEKWPAS
jgi:hypothetical protein